MSAPVSPAESGLRLIEVALATLAPQAGWVSRRSGRSGSTPSLASEIKVLSV